MQLSRKKARACQWGSDYAVMPPAPSLIGQACPPKPIYLRSTNTTNASGYEIKRDCCPQKDRVVLPTGRCCSTLAYVPFMQLQFPHGEGVTLGPSCSMYIPTLGNYVCTHHLSTMLSNDPTHYYLLLMYTTSATVHRDGNCVCRDTFELIGRTHVRLDKQKHSHRRSPRQKSRLNTYYVLRTWL